VSDTFGNLIERARSFLRDSGGTYIDDDDIGTWINEAHKDIAARLEVMQRTEEGTTTGTIPMPTTDGTFTVVILSLRIGITDIQFVSDAVFNSWADATSSPPTTLGRVWEDQIELYPTTTDAADYVLKVAFIPADLVNSEDVHVLPVQLERKLVEYAVAQANMKDSDYAASDRWFLKYEQGLPQISLGKTAQTPGTMSFQPAPTYWELDALQHRSSRA
jgi:hypothetical protein